MGFNMTDKKDKNQPSDEKSQAQNAQVIADAIADAQTNAQKTDSVESNLTPLEAAQKQIAELTDMLKRNQAEFSNYQKRQEQQSRQMVQFSSQRIITKLIPIFDMFDISVKHKDKVDEFIAGVEMIHASFAKLLADEQVIIPDLKGQKFDSKLAQAVGTRYVKGTPAGIVLEVATNAYVLGDRTIKYGSVIVSAAEESSSDASKQK